MARTNEFSETTQQLALSRQRFRCASCGADIAEIGNGGRSSHRFGEGAHGHHVTHVKLGGSSAVENCVVLCQSCHYNAHEGGNYRWGTVQGTEKDFPFFRG
jgi:5-methylcytosine-specific restriction endonuclease McrA